MGPLDIVRVRHRDEVRRVAVAAQQLFQLGFRHPGQDRGVGDLVAVQVQDGQHGAVSHGVQEVVRVPAGRQRPGFGLAVTDHDGGNQLGIVEDGPVGVRQGIPEFTALANGARSLGSRVAGDAARVGELPEQLRKPRFIVAHVAVDLRVGALQPSIGHYRGTAVAGPGDEQHLLPVPPDDPVEVGVDEVEPGGGAPVAQEPGLGVLRAERFAQQRVGAEVDLAHGQVVGRPPPAVHETQVAAVACRSPCFTWFGVTDCVPTEGVGHGSPPFPSMPPSAASSPIATPSRHGHNLRAGWVVLPIAMQ
ncbi:hypothetical protein D9M72_467800 [compost metagenome]